MDALTRILLLSPLLSLEHEDILSQCLQRCLLLQLAAVGSLGGLAQAHPVHHAHTLETLGALSLNEGEPLMLAPADPHQTVNGRADPA